MDARKVLRISRTPKDPRAFGNAWHTDQMFVPTPALGTILYGVTIPDTGGDTCFVNMYKAYDALSPGMKKMLAKVKTWAVGDKFKKFGGEKRADSWKGKATMRAKIPAMICKQKQPIRLFALIRLLNVKAFILVVMYSISTIWRRMSQKPF